MRSANLNQEIEDKIKKAKKLLLEASIMCQTQAQKSRRSGNYTNHRLAKKSLTELNTLLNRVDNLKVVSRLKLFDEAEVSSQNVALEKKLRKTKEI